MARPPQDVTDAELEVLRALWERERASIRQLTDDLYPGGGTSRYATVQKLLERMEAKHLVERDRSGFVHFFTPSLSRDDLIARRLRALARSLCGGSTAPLLSHLVRDERLSPQEWAVLNTILDRLDQPPAGQAPEKKG